MSLKLTDIERKKLTRLLKLRREELEDDRINTENYSAYIFISTQMEFIDSLLTRIEEY